MPSNHLIALPDIGHYMLKLEWGFANSAIQTIMLAVSLLLAQRVWSNEIEKDNFFQKTKRPMVLGIAGDSGVGKDTLVGAMGGVLGRNSLSHLSGDNYHFWDRDQINSNALTRLHPLSNDLANFSNDLEKLILGQDVDLIEYDHRVGRRKARTVVQGKDFIIASSLHAFLNGRIQSLVDLKIFIDMEPELKRFFKFRRDVNERGYHETDIRKELIRRETDFKKFVLPQKAVADITFGLFRSDPEEILNYKRKNYIPSIDLAVTVENFAVNGPLHRALLALSTTSVTVHYLEAERKYSILISGWVDADDIRNIAKLILPKMEDFYDTYPIWQSGNIGLMQLFTLNQIQENLNKVVMR
jgi:uridine kinase